MAYSLRQQERKNYRDLADVKLPPPSKKAKEDPLYAVEVLEKDEDSGRVKVHYVGYGAEYDEWKREEEIVQPAVSGRKQVISHLFAMVSRVWGEGGGSLTRNQTGNRHW